jgi:hypothetical protein
MGDRPESFSRCAQVKTKVHRKDYGWSVRLVYDLSERQGVTTVRPEVDGVLHDSRLNRIDRILIPLRYIFFFVSPPANNSEVKHTWPGAILGWVTDRKVFLGAHE